MLNLKLKTMKNLEREILNLSVIKPEDFPQYFLASKAFMEISKQCDYSAKAFNNYILELIKQDAGFLKSDFDIQMFVAELILLPFDIEELTDNELKFIRALSKRYLLPPERVCVSNYINIAIEKKAMKLN